MPLYDVYEGARKQRYVGFYGSSQGFQVGDEVKMESFGRARVVSCTFKRQCTSNGVKEYKLVVQKSSEKSAQVIVGVLTKPK